ncbi:MAG: hypothetical protein ACJ749_11685, partial [Flavisolibacter sp.]
DAAFRTAYLMYYNVEADLVGYPHLKLVMNGKVYEIHRIPNKDGTFLRERELYKGLLDARRGYLPSGIVSFPMTPEQSEKLTKFLIEEGSSSMKYAYFNKLFSKDTYNCGGILYEGLLKAGYKIPVMTRWNSMLPGQLFRRAYKNIPEARLVGVGKTWREEFVKPNWGTKSIPQRLPEKPKVSNNDCVLNGLQRLLNQ